MYVPSYALIARAVGLPETPNTPRQHEFVRVNPDTLTFLLRFVAFSSEYDEEVYRKENPDVAQAHDEGRIGDLRQHFVESGFFEGRKAANTSFDEAWYLKTYPDVADAIREGVISSAQTHFIHRGETEMRSPNAASLCWMQGWTDALSRQANDVT